MARASKWSLMNHARMKREGGVSTQRREYTSTSERLHEYYTVTTIERDVYMISPVIVPRSLTLYYKMLN